MPQLDWEQLAKATMHPLTVRILERAAADPDARFLPSELVADWGEPLGNCAYHTRTLLSRRLLKRAGSKTVRGAVQHFYRIAEEALL